MAHCAVYCAPVHTTAPRSTCFSKKLQESKAEEKPDTLRNPMALFFSSRIFVVKGQPLENYLNQQRCQQSGRVLSYLPGQNSNDLCSEYFPLCQFSSFIFCMK